MSAPLIYQWTGEAMVPLARFTRAANKEFVVGETYPLVVQEERSRASHSHYFASVTEAWKNLPEDQAERFASPDHLRRFALIKAGYRNERTLVCASKAEARRFAAFIRPIDEYAVIVVRDAVVIEYTAKSQSMKAMGRADFQASKEAVLGIVSEMIGVKADELSNNVRTAA